MFCLSFILTWFSFLSPSRLYWLKKIASTKSAYSSEFHIKILKQNIQKTTLDMKQENTNQDQKVKNENLDIWPTKFGSCWCKSWN